MNALARFLLVLIGVIAWVAPLGAQPHGPGPQADGKARILDHLLRLDDAELAELRQTIERIERMTPEERLAMRKRLHRIREEAPERLRQLRENYEAIPEERRRAMRDRWLELSPEERRDWRRKLRDMTPEERRQAIEAGEVLPPPRKGKKGPPARETPEN